MNFKYLPPIQRGQSLLLLITFLLLSGCTVYEIQEASEPLDTAAGWIMLPMSNHSDTPEAGERAADIAATLLRKRGIRQLMTYVPPADENILPELNQQKILHETTAWAVKQGYRFAFSGSIQEWRYKTGLDGEPVAGITLFVTDLSNGQVVWSASGSKTGWGRESASGVAHKLMAVLIDGLALK